MTTVSAIKAWCGWCGKTVEGVERPGMTMCQACFDQEMARASQLPVDWTADTIASEWGE